MKGTTGFVPRCLVVLTSLAALTIPGTVWAEEAEEDPFICLMTVGSQLNFGSYTPNKDAADRVDYSFRTDYWLIFDAIMLLDPGYFRMSMSAFSQLKALHSHSTTLESGSPTGDPPPVYLTRGAWVFPTIEAGYAFRLGPGKLGVGALLDVVVLPDGGDDEVGGFAFGPSLWYRKRVKGGLLIGSATLSLFRLTHPHDMSGGELATRLDAYVPLTGGKHKVWLTAGLGWLTMGYRPEDNDPDIAISAINLRFGVGMEPW